MKTVKFIPATLLMTTLAMSISGSALAHNSSANNGNECHLNLQNGVTISPDFVKVFDDNSTLFSIQENGDMTVNGKAVALTAEQQQLSADYAQGLRQAVPDAVDVALEAMEMATAGVNTAFTALFGDNSEIEHKVSGIIDKARDKINENMNRDGDLYTISPNSFSNLEDAFDNELEEEIEKVAMNSMGSIFSLLGDAMSSGSGNFEQRMEAFGEKMEKMGEDLETTLEAQGDKLEAKAEALCHQLKDIDKLESQLQQQVPQFSKYELLDMDESA